MASLLEVVIAFVAVMLVLALAAQSLQEVIKIMFAVKSQTAVRALKGLVLEAAKASKLLESDGDAIFKNVVERLQGLGQNGVRKTALRLDTLSAEKLASLIETATPVAGSSLEPTVGSKSDDRLKEVAKKVIDWFPLAWDPVDDRYRRRMRGFAILSAAIVVIGFNADAFAVLRRAREDPAYRTAVTGAAVQLDTLSQRQRRLADTTQTGGDTTAAGRQARADSLKAVTDSINATLLAIRAGQTGFVLGAPGGQRWDDIKWWIGILLSTLLVSLGAPFWHDALESLFGFKNRIQAQAKAASAVSQSGTLPTIVVTTSTPVPAAPSAPAGVAPAPAAAPKTAAPSAATPAPPAAPAAPFVSRLVGTPPTPPAGAGPATPSVPKPPVK